MKTATYETDFYAWTQQQAALLQAEELEQLDLPNLIEEIESMGKSQRTQLANRLRVLLMHLLKLRYQPCSVDRPARSWLNTIREQRNRIELVLRDSPSLRQELADEVAYAYPRARKQAAIETESLLATFPVVCPWTVEEILDEDWLPA
jgi:predicted DNA-binding ribbon-helix-helix protein